VIADGFWLGGLRAVCKAVGDGSAPRSLQSCPMPGLRGRLIHVCFICVASRSTRITPLSRYSVPSRATQQHVHSHVCSNVIGAIFADCVAQASVTEAIFADCVAQASVIGANFADCVAQQASLEQSLQIAWRRQASLKQSLQTAWRRQASLEQSLQTAWRRQASLEQSLQTARNKELLTKYRWNDTIRYDYR